MIRPVLVTSAALSFLALTTDLKGMTHALGRTGNWQVLDQSWVHSISAGWGINLSDSSHNCDVQTSQSCETGLEWSSIFNDGHSAGIAEGAPIYTTNLKSDETPDDRQFIWEAYLQANVTDAKTVTPALFYLS